MVLAGGVSPADHPQPGFYELNPEDRRRVIDALPRIAAALSRTASTTVGAHKEEKR
jgi:hypothetical protein